MTREEEGIGSRCIAARPIQTGEFGADMQICLTNDGPVTIIVDTKNRE